MSIQRRGRTALGRLALGMILANASGSGTFAAPAEATPAVAPAYGPVIPGLCLFAKAEALDRSQIGVSANQQLAQFAQGVDAELKAEQAAIVTDDRALAKQKATLAAAVFQQRVGQLRQRYADLARTKELRQAQLALTRHGALLEVEKVLTPGLSQTITARHCSAVFERSAVYGAADAMDITPAVVERMDAQSTSLNVRLSTPEEARAAQAPKP
jgi:Skp family chaperone for outer membrane proteins